LSVQVVFSDHYSSLRFIESTWNLFNSIRGYSKHRNRGGFLGKDAVYLFAGKNLSLGEEVFTDGFEN
jgi:hypothetical protein